jgi:hypothetical protein
MAMQVNTPDPPSYTIIEFIIPNGVYNVESLGDAIENGLNDWFAANWGSVPLPVATVTYSAPIGDFPGLLGSLEIGVTYLITIPLVAIDPDSTFISNSTSMLVLSAVNTYPTPTSEFTRLNFFSLSPYNYIDIISNTLSRSSKAPSTTNTATNYNSIHRIYSPQYGLNVYDYTQPLRWINLNSDDTIYNIDFRFVDSYGRNIQGALTRNFWHLSEWLLEK